MAFINNFHDMEKMLENYLRQDKESIFSIMPRESKYILAFTKSI